MKPQERKERTIKIGNVDVTFVHGDILNHLDWLESIKASLVLRRKLLTKCLEKNPYLIKNSVNLQPRWDTNPIQNLRWSGTVSNPSLTEMMIKLCLTDTVATISHNDGTLESLTKSLVKMEKTHVKELIIFHRDGEDYAE